MYLIGRLIGNIYEVGESTHLVQHVVAHILRQGLLGCARVHKQGQAGKAHDTKLPGPTLNCVHLGGEEDNTDLAVVSD